MKKTYFIDSSNLDYITTFVSPTRVYMQIKYKGKNAIVVGKASLIDTIEALFQNGEIDSKLAFALYDDFPSLAQDKLPINISNSFLVTPFKVVVNSLDAKEKEQGSQGEIYSETEQAELDEALSLSINSLPPQKAVTHVLLKETNANFFKAGITESLKPQSSQDAHQATLSTIAPECKLINSHRIGEFECTFHNDNQGILFSILLNETDKESLRISEENKKALLKCSELPDLFTVLKAMNQAHVVEIIEQYVESKGYDKGTISYGYKLSEAANYFDVAFFANPQTTENGEKKFPFTFKCKYSISKESVTDLLTKLKKDFFTAFPEPEHYFNAIETLVESKTEAKCRFTSHSAKGLSMTTSYFEQLFALLHQELEETIDTIEANKQSSCRLF